MADSSFISKEDAAAFLRERAAALHARRRGMGDASSDLRALPLPPPLERYLQTGAPMSTIRRDLGAATAQIPRWGYVALAAVAFLLAGSAYRRWRDTPPTRTPNRRARRRNPRTERFPKGTTIDARVTLGSIEYERRRSDGKWEAYQKGVMAGVVRDRDFAAELDVMAADREGK